MAVEKAFVVWHKEAELLGPAKPTPQETKELSDIDDQKGLRFHFCMIMFYRANPLMKAKDPVEAIRDAVAKALVWYYPLAGRLIQGPEDKFMVDCSAQGIWFVEADSSLSLEDLGDAVKPPCLYSKEFLYEVPGSHQILGCPLMIVQVTRLICGGFVVAIRVNHVLTDGLGLAQFVKAVGELAQGASSPSTKPVWQRELLTAKHLPFKTTYDHPEYGVVSHEDDPTMDHHNMVSRSFFFGPKEIRAIRRKLPPQAHRRSNFDVITACIWRSRTRALKLKRDEKVSIACMVNIRNKSPVPLENGYYGNGAVTPAAATEAGRLCDNPLKYAVELVERAKERVNEDYVKSVVNYMDLKGRPPILRSERNYVVSDSSKLGFDKVDFGWGKPVYGGTMEGGSGNNSIYAPYRNSDGEAGVLVPVFLPAAAMERFEVELKKLTAMESGEFFEPLKPFLNSAL
ncbi:PREDICTED: methanol O-anthraniloyltransferase-like [Ipomoea nil]|uniref:methanol O-anthraniloyltransferase-like n=1 Tax=Ipomoea nil TaxID=35883 RepID=UPI0009011894|nr:PREDICTED: methanol O-anthraniloyltransferase-like [Ipomoea nil]